MVYIYFESIIIQKSSICVEITDQLIRVRDMTSPLKHVVQVNPRTYFLGPVMDSGACGFSRQVYITGPTLKINPCEVEVETDVTLSVL